LRLFCPKNSQQAVLSLFLDIWDEPVIHKCIPHSPINVDRWLYNTGMSRFFIIHINIWSFIIPKRCEIIGKVSTKSFYPQIYSITWFIGTGFNPFFSLVRLPPLCLIHESV
jgi:hypothetical protein